MPTGEASFRVLLRVDVRPGMGTDFEQTWLSIGDAVTSHPANVGQWLLHGEDGAGDGQADVYYIVSDWTDEAGFREFEHSDEHVLHRQRLHPFRSGGSMATMSVVHHLTATAGAGRARAGAGR